MKRPKERVGLRKWPASPGHAACPETGAGGDRGLVLGVAEEWPRVGRAASPLAGPAFRKQKEGQRGWEGTAWRGSRDWDLPSMPDRVDNGRRSPPPPAASQSDIKPPRGARHCCLPVTMKAILLVLLATLALQPGETWAGHRAGPREQDWRWGRPREAGGAQRGTERGAGGGGQGRGRAGGREGGSGRKGGLSCGPCPSGGALTATGCGDCWPGAWPTPSPKAAARQPGLQPCTAPRRGRAPGWADGQAEAQTACRAGGRRRRTEPRAEKRHAARHFSIHSALVK